MSDVAVLAIGPHDDWRASGADAGVAAVATVASLAEIRDAARGLDAPLVWLVDSGATPSAGALRALLDAAHTPVASLPVDDRRAPIEAVLGRFADSDKLAVLDAVSRGCVPLRHTHVISLLVERGALLEHAPPDAALGRYAGSEWTARVFARTPGMLVPASTVRPRTWAPGMPRDALRMTRTGVWRRGETLRELQRSLVGGR